MIGEPSVRTLVTNIGRGGRWVVVQTIEIEHGYFESRAAAEEFEQQLEGAVKDLSKGSLERAARDMPDHAQRAEDALRKLAGVVIADAEAMERGYLHYDVEYEGIVRDRANVAARLLGEVGIERPPSPYSSDGRPHA